MANKTKYEIRFAIKEVEERLRVFLDGYEKTNACAYHEVKKNEVLAVVQIIRPKEEQEKLDEDETELTPDQLPSFFEIGEGITRVMNGNSQCIYIAPEKGLVRFSPESITHLTDKPVIKEDVSAQTGDIKYSGDIICQEHVRSTTRLDVDGDITIAKTVEDHVKINCKGNLEIGWGANGKSTLICCKKNCNIGYLENCLLICDGDVEIKTHTFMARIYSRSHVKVMGTGLISKSRATTVGGVINALGSVQLKSAGADGCETKIIVGINLRIQAQLKEAKVLHSEMERAILISQQEIETYISVAGKAENLSKMGNKAKETVRTKLLDLKKEQKSLMALEGKINKLKNMLYTKDPKTSYVSFQDFLDPIVIIQILDSEEVYRERVSGTSRFKLADEKVTKVI